MTRRLAAVAVVLLAVLSVGFAVYRHLSEDRLESYIQVPEGFVKLGWGRTALGYEGIVLAPEDPGTRPPRTLIGVDILKDPYEFWFNMQYADSPPSPEYSWAKECRGGNVASPFERSDFYDWDCPSWPGEGPSLGRISIKNYETNIAGQGCMLKAILGDPVKFGLLGVKGISNYEWVLVVKLSSRRFEGECAVLR